MPIRYPRRAGLLDIGPSATVNNVPNHPSCNTKLDGQLFVGAPLRVKIAYLLYLILCQFGRMAVAHIHRMGNWLQMVWIDARRIKARVMQFLAVWCRSIHLLPQNDIGVFHLPLHALTAVSQWISTPVPIPATRSIVHDILRFGWRILMTIDEAARLTLYIAHFAMRPLSKCSSLAAPALAQAARIRFIRIWLDWHPMRMPFAISTRLTFKDPPLLACVCNKNRFLPASALTITCSNHVLPPYYSSIAHSNKIVNSHYTYKEVLLCQ